MDTWVIVAIVAVIAVIAIAAIVAYLNMQQRQSRELKSQFGGEYEREVETRGKRDAERELAQRQERVEKLRIKELDREERLRFAEEWRSVQAHFVDEPSQAINEADSLVQRVMDRRGYPISDFEQQAADISVDHPEVVTNYREAHSIAETHRREQVSTEQLRQAMIHYRALFSDLLGEVAARR